MHQIGQSHIAEKFSAYPVCDTVYHFRAVTCRVDVDTKRMLPERCIHDFTIALATSVTSASGTAVRANPFMISSPVSLWGRTHARQGERYHRAFAH